MIHKIKLSWPPGYAMALEAALQWCPLCAGTAIVPQNACGDEPWSECKTCRNLRRIRRDVGMACSNAIEKAAAPAPGGENDVSDQAQ